MSAILVFDIETIPDINAIRRLEELPETMSNVDVANYAFNARKEKVGSEFLPHYLHQIIAISCVFRDKKGFRVKSLGEPSDDEATLIQQFFRIIEKYTPQLVSWNGSGFDLPVLNYRSLLHGIAAPRYWDLGEDDRDFKWNNYLNRYHLRHLDLMDLLALYQARANAPLDLLAKLCGFPGKQGMEGQEVWPAYLDNKIEDIRHYCETDVVNTYLLYTRFQLMRGALSKKEYNDEIALIKNDLHELNSPQWEQYLSAFTI